MMPVVTILRQTWCILVTNVLNVNNSLNYGYKLKENVFSCFDFTQIITNLANFLTDSFSIKINANFLGLSLAFGIEIILN